MTIHRIALATAALLLGATPIAQAGGRHVDISVNLGYYLPVHMGYVEQVAPVVVYPPAPAIYYRPAYYRPAYYRPVYAAPGRYYYRERDRYDRHDSWRQRVEQSRHRDGDHDRDRHRDRD